MQKAYLKKLYEIAEKDPNVILLLADSGSGFDALFKNYLPKQIIDFGIAEENMVASAAGMASCGKIPFVYTAGAFLAYRSMEFIRDDVCFLNHNVKFIGMGTGLGWSTLGPTHHTTEDLGILRSLPNLTVLSPSSPIATAECVRLAYETKGPVYVRIGMGGEKEIYQEDEKFELGDNKILSNGNDLTIFSLGTMSVVALEVKEKLMEQGINAQIVDVVSVSPFDKQSVVDAINKNKPIITIEEHSIVGGLGSIISEIIAESGKGVNLLKIGFNKQFAKGYGTIDEVRAQNGLDANSINNKIVDFMKGLK